MNDFNKAQEWANNYTAGEYCPGIDGPWAAAEIIKSLPDQWVGAEKLCEIIEEMNEYLEAECSNDYGQGYNYATRHWREALESLLTPKLPTLADMTQKEREACKWMQARLEGSELDFVIPAPGWGESMLWAKDGATHIADNEKITPLPGEPKLGWPGSEPQPSKVSLSEMWVDDGRSPVDALKLPADKYEELDRIKPEDVPADELWLVEYDNHQWLGKRNRKGSANYPWRVASLDGDGSDISSDSRITLIHKLVPEPPALPDGMRLADHETYGRVVVSPRMDSDDEYKASHPDPVDTYGIDWQYVPQSELTFLDGE